MLPEGVQVRTKMIAVTSLICLHQVSTLSRELDCARTHARTQSIDTPTHAHCSDDAHTHARQVTNRARTVITTRNSDEAHTHACQATTYARAQQKQRKYTRVPLSRCVHARMPQGHRTRMTTELPHALTRRMRRWQHTHAPSQSDDLVCARNTLKSMNGVDTHTHTPESDNRHSHVCHGLHARSHACKSHKEVMQEVKVTPRVRTRASLLHTCDNLSLSF